MQAVLKSVEADMQLKENNYQRNNTLKKNSGGNLPIQKDWDRDYAAYLSANASYESSKAQVQEAQFAFESTQYDLDKTVIYAPIDGVVLSRNVDLGQTVAAMFQTPVLFKLSDNLSQMELQVSIDEADVAQIKEGQPVLFSVDAYPDENFHAAVKSIRVNSETLAGVVTYRALLSVENQAHKLLPGMSADADIIIKHIGNAWIVPRAALLYIPVEIKKKIKFGAQNTEKLELDTQPHVWVERGETAEKIYVKILGTSGTQTAVESEALKPEDKLILSQEQRS
jgi:HlyD family secretion protein